MKSDFLKNKCWEKQNSALRNPAEVICHNYFASGLLDRSLHFKADKHFIKLLARLKITLLATREYEHLAMALNSKNGGKIEQSFIHLPHPSGVAVDRNKKIIYIASTRNPNQIWEFKPLSRPLKRTDCHPPLDQPAYLMPSRIKFYPGAFYFHDLAFIKNKLYGASSGQNAIVQINFNNDNTDKIAWQPRDINESANYIQLNSIAAGASIRASFFSASGDSVSPRRPGHLNYPVDKKGVIFSGANGKVIAYGLTRPHSARIQNGLIWVNNSGYGEFGYIENEKFRPIINLQGWTRGLCLINNTAFVGVSRVLPKFRNYAPGLKNSKQICGIFAIDINTAKILGSIIWPMGNQIFSLDWIDQKVTPGFAFNKIKKADKREKELFYTFQL